MTKVKLYIQQQQGNIYTDGTEGNYKNSLPGKPIKDIKDF
ncbi:hypothetical protein CHCC20441_4187 [Bacillus licheniformis]|nr:hypothetical protein B4091_2452 [Bacillus licheniformis]OLF95303.1 hypothetical protein B4094_1349 [Bacillus licheniformis]OLF96848.1 hypothetical protein B4089_0449 [Bacillus licheniformis]OLG02235.1 hypothetical protein B4124_2979 [Bacillus licheniformis]TWJ40142.1 hypothetical protein CHCC5026_0061 [Bacillus licheniformis]